MLIFLFIGSDTHKTFLTIKTKSTEIKLYSFGAVLKFFLLVLTYCHQIKLVAIDFVIAANM